MTGGAKPRQKGDRAEREIISLHQSLGVDAERYPLSGASNFRGSGHDVDIYVNGKAEAPFVAEVKSRKNGNGFVQLETWLGEYDILFLRRNHAQPLIVLPWRIWAALLAKVKP
jgi:Holliday junction resolvase